jgi:Putative Ig domain
MNAFRNHCAFRGAAPLPSAAGLLILCACASTMAQTAPGIAIQPSTLPHALPGQPYSATLQASGGQAPYTYRIASGSLPAGLALNATTGAITGSASGFETGTFTVEATDAAQKRGTAAYAIVIDLPQVSGVHFQLPANVTAGQQSTVSVELTDPYPVDLNGTLYLDFFADPSLKLQDDLSIQFAPQGRNVPFTIPANTTKSVFPNGSATFQTGTSAGDLFLSVALRVGSREVTPSQTPFQVVHIAKSAPVLTSVVATPGANGVSVAITGFSTARELSSVKLHLVSAPGYDVQDPDLTVDVTSAAAAYYARTDTEQFGSQFTVTIPISLGANQAAVSSVAVTLSDSLGNSSTTTANVQ